MSKVDELIRELCPDGVQRVALGEVAKYVRGLTYRKSDEVSEGGVPVLRANNITLGSNRLNQDDLKRVSDHLTISEDKILGAGDTLICAGSGSKEHVGKVAFSEEDTRYAFGGFMAVIRSMSPAINPRFLFHNLSSKYFRDYLDRVLSTSTINNLNARIVEAFSIPLLPLELQEEIVRILDQFMELDRELEQEIAGRTAQFDRLREDLLSDENYPPVPVGNLAARVSTGATPKASEARYYQGGDIPWLRTGEVNFGEIWETEKLITQTALDETNVSWIAENCVVVAISGATAGRVAVNKIPMTTNQHCCNMQIDPEMANYRFVFHALASSYEEMKAQGRGARGDLNISLIKGFPIPLPPLEVQEEIANKLDTFTEYIDNLKRERELRQKQYEYYRDQLLDFPVKE